MDAKAQFQILFQDAYPALRRYGLHRGLTAPDADDLVADTLEIAWRRRSDVPADDPLPWLYTVARNVLRNQQRKQRRRGLFLSRLRVGEEAADPVAASVADAAALRAALAGLNREDRELLTLIAWDGLSSSQAAVTVGCSPAAVRVRLNRARNRLAARLGFDLRSGPGAPRPRSPEPGPAQVGDGSPVENHGGMR